MKTIEIVISPTGVSTLTTKGYWGTGCREASRLIEQALGKTTGERLTGAFYAPREEAVPQQQKSSGSS